MLGCLSQIHSHYSGCTFVCKSVVSMTDAEHTAQDGVALTRNSYSFHFILNSMILNSRGSLVFNLIKEMFSKLYYDTWASQVVLVVKNLPPRAGRHKRPWFTPWVGKIPCRRTWQPTPVFLPRESHGQRSLVGFGPWGHKE